MIVALLFMLVRDAASVVRVLRAWKRSQLAGFMGTAASIGWFTALTLTAAANVRTLGLTDVGRSYYTHAVRIVTDLEAALDARRERILISRSQVGLVKWSCLLVQAICALFAIALVHSDNRLTAAIAMGVFATGVAASVLLIAAYDRPFVGQLAVGSEPLLQVMAQADTP